MTDNNAKILPRPPVVAVVGHVDHGKTTLLDFIRKANVVSREAGGITQAVGAYEIEHPATGGKKITFIDTPGHEAFSRMRAHGAAAADIAILVVAADEGVKPQTEEAIKILKETKTPFVVAITKIDKPSANVEKVKGELLTIGVALEGFGGDVSWHGVSGSTGEGVSEILDLILLVGEVEGLSYDPNAGGEGFVIESRMDSKRGITANVILKNGSIKRGDEISTQTAHGKIKILENFLGKQEKAISPSSPATISGWDIIPKAGEEFWIGEHMNDSGGKLEEESAVSEADSIGEDDSMPAAVLKADTAGSLEALRGLLSGKVNAKRAAVGEISDDDIKYAQSTGSMVVGFNVGINKAAERLADLHGVRVITSDIIYKLYEAVEELIEREREEDSVGTAEILAVFSKGRGKITVGGVVTGGEIRTGERFNVVRGEEIIGKGKITNLQKNKQETREVGKGSEFGAVISLDAEIEKGDIIQIVI